MLQNPVSVEAATRCVQRAAPLERRDVFERLAGLWQRAVGSKRLVVEQLTHGDVGELLHQLEGVVDVQEHGEEVLGVARAHSDALREHQGGVLLQLGHLGPLHHQGHWGGRRRDNQRLKSRQSRFKGMTSNQHLKFGEILDI